MGDTMARGVSAPRRRPVVLTYSRNVYLLLIYTLGKGLQLTINALSINLYAYSLGYRSDFIGLLAGMPSIGALVAGVPIGLLADRIGRKPLILTSGALTPLTLVAVGLSSSAPLLLLASFTNGVLASAYWVTNLPMLTESTTNEQRMSALSISSFLLLGVGALGSSIGGAVPQFVGGLLHVSPAATIPLRWSVLASAVVAAVPALPLVLLREPRRARGHAVPHPNTPIVVDDIPIGAERMRRLENSGRWGVAALFAMLLVPDVLITTGEGAVSSLLQLYYRLKFNLLPGNLGLILTFTGLAGGAAALIAPRVVRRLSKLRAVVTVIFLSVPAVIGIGLSPTFLIAAGFDLTRNVLRGLNDPIYAAFTMESISSRYRGTLSGFYGITWGVGFSVGASIAGLLQQNISLSAPFMLGALCLTLAPSLLLAFFARKKATSANVVHYGQSEST